MGSRAPKAVDSRPGRLRQYAKAVKAELYALYLAAQHPRTPWYTKAIAFLTIAYALSPIDLIPDFIPVLGYLDDLIIVPLGIRLCLRSIPADVMRECRARATALDDVQKKTELKARPLRWVGVFVIAAIWMMFVALTGQLIWDWWRP